MSVNQSSLFWYGAFTNSSLELQLFKGRLCDAFKKEKAEHKAK